MSYLSVLLVLFSSVAFSSSDWTMNKLPISIGEGELPSIYSDSKLSIAYLVRHPVKKDTKLYFIVSDDSCKIDSSDVGMHFVYLNDEKDLFMSSCWDEKYRRFHSLSGGYLLTEQFLNEEYVVIREIEPRDGWIPLNQKFSALNFKKIFYAYNKQTAP